MIKKILTLVALFVLSMHIANAIPAYNRPVVITQPDGSQLTIIGHGDEFLNYITTADGYTIVKGADNYYHYANVVGGKLVASEVIARDADARSAQEVSFLSARAKNLRPEMTASQMELRKHQDELVKQPQFPRMKKAPKKGINTGDYKGLVILVNFTDKKFRLEDDANGVISDMMNKENYDGFEDPDYGFQEYTGSVHDYFIDNSMGQFNANFDVVGPVDINYASTYAKATTNSFTLARAALDAVDDQVDFSEYDSDGDGYVDMFYIIYAGYAASYTGNNSNYLWPHASNLNWYGFKYDGVTMGRYACSTEIYGYESSRDRKMEGIGTIVHEFSHVLGYPDLYDVNYQGYDEPGDWDVMSGGSYNNFGRTPVGYSAFERYFAGFLDLDYINELGTYSLEPVHTSNKAYRIDTPRKSAVSGKVLEYFIFENRKREKWDEYLPGEGMLVTRIDSTKANLWSSNRVNSTDRSGVKIIRADGTLVNSESNTFPGKKNITYITNESDANLLNYEEQSCIYNIFDIAKEGDDVSFRVVEDGYNPIVVPDNALFYESFYFCNGQGGNDGNFKVVGGAELKADNKGWKGTNVHSANACAVVGKSTYTTKEESITTPAITLEEGKEYKFTFSAAGYNSQSNEPLNVTVAEGNATLEAETVDLEKAVWNDYSLTLTGSGAVKISLGRKKSAFYLDTVMVAPSEASAIEDITIDMTGNGALYNLAGQKVNADYKGVVIRNGKKYLNR